MTLIHPENKVEGVFGLIDVLRKCSLEETVRSRVENCLVSHNYSV